MNLLDHAAGHISVCYMQYLLCGPHQTDVALQFWDKTNLCVVEFILPLCDCCIFVVKALLYITVAYDHPLTTIAVFVCVEVAHTLIESWRD